MVGVTVTCVRHGTASHRMSVCDSHEKGLANKYTVLRILVEQYPPFVYHAPWYQYHNRTWGCLGGADVLVLLLLLSAVRLSSPVRGVGARGGAGLLPRVRRIGHFSRSRRLTGTSRTRGGRSQEGSTQ